MGKEQFRNGERNSPWPGFWARFGAALIDFVAVGAIGMALGAAAFDTLAAMGEWARIIGFLVALVYFGVFSSPLGDGRTLGMRLIGLQVVGGDGGLLDVQRAFLRAAIVALLLALNGVMWPTAGSGWAVLSAAAGFAFVALAIAELYLLIFNRPSRRLVHDYAVGSSVVRRGRAPEPAPLGRKHVIGCIAAPAVLALIGLAVSPVLQPMTARLEPVQRAVNALPNVLSSGVVENTSVMKFSGQPTVRSHSLIVSVRLRQRPVNPAREAAAIAPTVRANYQLAPDQTLRVVMAYGYNMGIASSTRSHAVDFPSQ